MSASACGGDGDDTPQIAEGIFAPLGEPMPSATPSQLGLFMRGRAVSLHRFSRAEGLGPQFNVTFCAACHEKPVFGGSAGRYRNFLLVGQALGDGSFTPTGVNGVQSQYALDERSHVATDDVTNVVATRNPIPFFGAGLLAEISDEEILSRADPDDEDGDGISGRPNFDRGFVGRFGRKAQNVAIESFIRGPLFNHLGITTNPLTPERREELPVASGDGALDAPDAPSGTGSVILPQVGAPNEPTLDNDGVPDPEMTEDELFDLIAFSMLLAAPQPDPPTPDTERGRELFTQTNCTGCHTPTLLGPRGLIPAFSDLLIHDMGPDLADGVPQGNATGSEFRTAPLWGVAALAPYLHDGRADTLDEAIRLHAGEAQASRDAYVALSEADRGLVIAFLESLGGASQRTDGLLPPGAVVQDPGEYGGPTTTLAGEDLDRYVNGRTVFDRDFAIGSGLGPRFNGDACRACHFDPVIGGAGPSDVNVTRHGIVDELTGAFTFPSIGTMAHRHEVETDQRPPVDLTANVFEHRQTPPLFGLGLIDQIPRETIEALADPEDNDADGISGVAHVLPDGRLGRLGWKANVPSLAEFARDGMTNELGITVPDQPGLTFGLGDDADAAADPEISLAELEDMVFYMQNLAPPPRTSFDPDREAEGEQIFAAIGCDACHVPTLQTADGADVPLFSDLLLHDVAPPLATGIEEGFASVREFRTPPLWGLGRTAPYMHDGKSFTVEDAILAHNTEARRARDAYLDLTPSLQEALLFFLESL